jgi:hypothetical protein
MSHRVESIGVWWKDHPREISRRHAPARCRVSRRLPVPYSDSAVRREIQLLAHIRQSGSLGCPGTDGRNGLTIGTWAGQEKGDR